MFKISIPQLEDKVLFTASLEPATLVIDKLAKRKDMGEGEIKAVLGKKNKVAIGMPYYENLISRLIEEKEKIPYEIKQMMADYDFHYISLACSFLPDTDCRFQWARFGVELSAISKSGEKIQDKPIAYDMFPQEVSSEIKCRKEVNFKPELKLSLDIMDTDMKYASSESHDFILYEPQIIAYGIRRPSVAWDFKSVKERGIWGNKNLLLIVRTPKNSKIKGRFLLGAEIEFNIGKWIRIALAKRKDDAVDVEYYLSN